MNQQALVNNYLNYVQTYEQTIAITESQMEEYLLEMSNNSDKVFKWIAAAEKELKKRYNISFEPIKILGRKQGALLQREFKKKTPPEVLGKKIGKSVKNMLVKQGKQAIKNIGGLEIEEKVALGILALIVIIFVNGLLMGLAGKLLSGQVLQYVSFAVIAPMVEEASKTFFITKGMPWVGTTVTYGMEALMYILPLLMAGTRLGPTLLLRGAALGMHFSTTYIQKQIIDSGKLDETKALYIAWGAGVCVHASWNVMSILMDDKVRAFLIG